MPGKSTIALVNNDKSITASVRMLLEGEQYEVRTYSNTSDALELIEDPADLALLDKTNPPLGGMELYRRIRARHAMPVIFLSAWAEELEEELRGTGIEAQGYIPLPFSRSFLFARVSVTLIR